MAGDVVQLLEGTSRTVKKVRGGGAGEKYLHTKIPTNAQQHKQLATGSVCSTRGSAEICTVLPWWGPGQGGTAGSRCENQQVKNVHGFWKYRSPSLLWEMW